MGKYDPTNHGELKKYCKLLNGMEEVTAKIKIVGVDKSTLVENFIKTVNALDEAGVDIAEEIITFYNDGIKEITETLEEDTEGEEDTEEDPALKKEKKVKKPKPHKEKKVIKLSIFGSRVGTQAAAIDEMLLKGITIIDMAKQLKTTPSRVKSHIEHLKTNKKVEIVCENGVYTAKAPKAPK